MSGGEYQLKSSSTPPNRAALLEIERLNVHYGAHHALKDMSLRVKAGELVGIIGPNGAGKTSFIKALCGRLKHKGSLSIQGTSLKHGADRRKHIGLVPQDIGLYPHLTAQENLTVMGGLLGLPKSVHAQLASQALMAVDMTAHKDKRVSDLSGGMKRRINVAAAIMHDPALIIFDEPTAGVDVPARDTVHKLARELAQGGAAVLLITHELDQAEALCDKILVLNQGETLAYDNPSAILSHSFKGAREVIVRFATTPDQTVIQAMQPFEFTQGEMPTIWRAMTQAGEVSFVSAFMTALGGARVAKARHDRSQFAQQNSHDAITSTDNAVPIIREITVRRPGLTALMHRIEATGKV